MRKGRTRSAPDEAAPLVRRMWRAACREEDPDLFYSNDRGTDAPEKYPRAREVCGRCEVREECRQLVDLLEGRTVLRNMVHGVWAGETPEERIRRRWEEKRAVQQQGRRVAG